MRKEIITIKNVKGYIGEDGFIYLSLEDIAKGLGFVKRDVKNGIVYERINKQNIIKWLIEFGIINSEKENLPEYIPENIFYLLAMKGKNEVAKQFQLKVANEILPQIRKTGIYGITEKDKYLLRIMKSTSEVEKAAAISDYETNYVKPLELENEKQKEEIEVKDTTISHKQDVIDGLTDSITLYDKRDIIQRIIKKDIKNIRERWNELYRCFTEEYHINLKVRCENYNKTLQKSKRVSTFKYAELFGFIDKLYNICVKLYETDIENELVRLGFLR